MFNLWWSAELVLWRKLTDPMKRPLFSHQKMKCLFFDYMQLLMISRAIWVTKVDWNVKKGPLSHHKMKCSFLDYIQLLIIGWAIRAMKVEQNVKKGPLSHLNNEMLIFGLFLTFDDQPSDLSDKIWPKCKKRPPMFIKKWNSHVLDYIQLLMVQAEWSVVSSLGLLYTNPPPPKMQRWAP